MKYYKSPKTRIKVTKITKNEGSEKCEYTPQVKNKYWFFYWILCLFTMPFLILLFTFCQPIAEILFKYLKHLCSFYGEISIIRKPFLESLFLEEDKSLENAQSTIETYLASHYENWQKLHTCNQQKTAKIKKQYINFP